MKTLKDLSKFVMCIDLKDAPEITDNTITVPVRVKTEDVGSVNIKELRHSAIEWIKHIEKDIKVIEEAEQSPEAHPLGGMVTHGLTEELEGQIKWIKMFFNIEEKDINEG